MDCSQLGTTRTQRSHDMSDRYSLLCVGCLDPAHPACTLLWVKMGEKWVNFQLCHIPNEGKAASQYLSSNNNDSPSITKYGFLVQPRDRACCMLQSMSAVLLGPGQLLAFTLFHKFYAPRMLGWRVCTKCGLTRMVLFDSMGEKIVRVEPPTLSIPQLCTQVAASEIFFSRQLS